MAKFPMFKDNRGEYRWQLKAANGAIVGDSGEGYTAKSSYEDAIDWGKTNASGASTDDDT